MKREDEVYRLERRIGHLEREVSSNGQAIALMAEKMAHLADRSDERLQVLNARFDKIDRRAAWWVNGIFAIALAAGGIYLESYLNKDDRRDSADDFPVELRDDPKSA